MKVMTFDGHTANVVALGFHRDGKWMFTGSEDGTIKIWDIRSQSQSFLMVGRVSGAQREYKCKAAVNSAILHPNQVPIVNFFLRSVRA